MKTQIESSPFKLRITHMIRYAMFVGAMCALSSCSDNDDARPDTRAQFIGTYAVEDVSGGSGYIYEYDVTISNGDNGELNISNFADIFNTPVKATVDGNKITIKSQSFTNSSSGNTIKVSGSGTLAGSTLTFSYTTEGYLDYTGNCTANKKQ